MVKTLYVMGVEGRMKTFDRPPNTSSYTPQRFDGTTGPTKTHSGWPGGGLFFLSKRGILEEWRDPKDGRVYIRRVPAEMVEELEAVDLRIASLEEALRDAKRDRQLVLKAAAVRGARGARG